jgi:type VI secretion system secreted protein Hcp
MAFAAFLKIDGIPGESTDQKHEGWSEILSYQHEMDQPASSTASSAGGGSGERVNVADFTIVKTLDMASTKIYEACCRGQHIKTVVVELCTPGGAKYMEFKMEDVIISNVRPSGHAQGAPRAFRCRLALRP